MFTRGVLVEFLQQRYAQVEVLEVYNHVSPYFLFFCSDAPSPFEAGFFASVESYLAAKWASHVEEGRSIH